MKIALILGKRVLAEVRILEKKKYKEDAADDEKPFGFGLPDE